MVNQSVAGAFASQLAASFAALGMDHVCVLPGSRSTPLALAFAAHPGITDWSHHDERSAAFFAIGIARTTMRPVGIITTSGTAAAELHPALAEAVASRVPIIALTADRPPELRDVGAPQSINQVNLFGSTVKWAFQAGVPDEANSDSAGPLAARAWAAATDRPAGPVHLNLPFREPLMAPGDGVHPVIARTPELIQSGAAPADADIARIAERLDERKVVIIAGAEQGPVFPASCARLASALGAPILADPLSGLRHGIHDRSAVIVTGDLLVGAGLLDRLRPDAVVRFGALPTSKPVWQWLANNHETYQAFIEPAGWRDPLGSASTVIRGDAAATAEVLAKAVGGADDAWLAAWQQADKTAAHAVELVLGDEQQINEPGTARLVTSLTEGVLGLGSSMPIRDVDAFGVSSPTPLVYVANRGANGVDGTISMTLGAIEGSNRRGVCLLGDVAALHDIGAMATARRLGTAVTIVVVHNDGGGIFHFLPQRALADPAVFEKHFGTPHGLDFTTLAEAFGVPAVDVDTPVDLADALTDQVEGPQLIQIRTDREANVEVHGRLRAAVADSLDMS